MGKSLDEQLVVEGGSPRPRGWGGRVMGRACKREKWRKQELGSNLLLRSRAEARREQSRGDRVRGTPVRWWEAWDPKGGGARHCPVGAI